MSPDPGRQLLIRRVLILVAAALVVGAVIALFLSPTFVDPGSTVSGVPRNQAVYIEASDGTRIAADIWLPAELESGARVPTVVRFTRSWRSLRFNPKPPFLLRALMALRLAPRLRDPNAAEADAFNHAGYALVIVDVRGTGASFGSRPFPWSAQERWDYKAAADWIVAQPWSDGGVGAYGTGYSGTAALFLAASRHPAVKAVAPRFAEFDPVFRLFRPGGLLNTGFVDAWSRTTRGLDSGDFCAAFDVEPEACAEAQRLILGVKPVDADPEGVLVDEAMAERKNADEGNAVGAIEYRDQVGPTGASPGSISPYGSERVIEEGGAPIHSWASWYDAATAASVLDQYQALGNPQVLTIGPWSHGGIQVANPFRPGPEPAAAESEYEEMIQFFDRHLKDGAAGRREIRYYTVGEETWKTTLNWPPPRSSPERWYLAEGGRLADAAPEADTAADTYPVDFTATTGDHGRWRKQATGGPVVFADRRAEDAKLLTYTTGPLDAAVEITGNPRVTLEMTSTATDGALHVYLETVAPDSTVTLLTEGVLRLRHYRLTGEIPAYEGLDPRRTFRKDQGRPLVPDEPFLVEVGLLPLSVLVPPGHRLRIAVAGADAGVFERCPAEGDPVLTVFRDRERPSFVDLPVVR